MKFSSKSRVNFLQSIGHNNHSLTQTSLMLVIINLEILLVKNIILYELYHIHLIFNFLKCECFLYIIFAHIFFFIFKYLFVCFEREKEKCGEGAEAVKGQREKERISSSLPTEHGAPPGARSQDLRS